jgi:putative SOS response-associated peptidase YedK
MRWGLIPAWATDKSIGNQMINARSETLAQKPTFKRPFASQRCIIMADGYYEWQKTDEGKQPYWIHRRDEKGIPLAGLWESNRRIDPEQTIVSATIITTAANATTRSLHERMPVILAESDVPEWLDPDQKDVLRLQSLLGSAPEDLLEFRQVSKMINRPNYDAPIF